jgi:hypothetical protein
LYLLFISLSHSPEITCEDVKHKLSNIQSTTLPEKKIHGHFKFPLPSLHRLLCVEFHNGVTFYLEFWRHHPVQLSVLSNRNWLQFLYMWFYFYFFPWTLLGFSLYVILQIFTVTCFAVFFLLIVLGRWHAFGIRHFTQFSAPCIISSTISLLLLFFFFSGSSFSRSYTTWIDFWCSYPFFKKSLIFFYFMKDFFPPALLGSDIQTQDFCDVAPEVLSCGCPFCH